MWSSNNITGLFDHQYFWEEYVIFDYFRCRYSPSKGAKVASQTTLFGCVCLGIPSHTETWLDFIRVSLVGLGT